MSEKIVQIAVTSETPSTFPVLFALTNSGRIFMSSQNDDREFGDVWKEALLPEEILQGSKPETDG